MFATRPLRAASGYPGFLRRSMDEFKRQANIAIRMEGLHRPTKPYPLIQFQESGSIDRCKIMSDRDMGGFSQAELTFQDGRAHAADATYSGLIGNEERSGAQEKGSQESSGSDAVNVAEPAHALFKGKISTELPPNKPEVQRSGYAAWRTRDRGLSLFGRLLWDIDPFSYLALRIKSDGRKYFVNIQTESIVPTDLHQHLLPTYTPGEWETVIIPFSAFVRTNYGMVVEPQKEMLRQKVKSVGIGLIDRVPGPFELRIADVYATNQAPLRKMQSEDSGFEMGSQGSGMFDEATPRRKKGEPERILI